MKNENRIEAIAVPENIAFSYLCQNLGAKSGINAKDSNTKTRGEHRAIISKQLKYQSLKNTKTYYYDTRFYEDINSLNFI